MEKHTLSPPLLNGDAGEPSEFLTPEQDNTELKLKNHALVAGPKQSDKIRGPIVKSKVDPDTVDDSLSPEYAVVKSNRGKVILKCQQNISAQQRHHQHQVPQLEIKPVTKSTATRTTSTTKQNGPRLPQANQMKITKVPSHTHTSTVPNHQMPVPASAVSKMPNPHHHQSGVKKTLRPTHTSPSIESHKTTDKFYDPATIKSFMEEKREVRRLREKQEQQEKLKQLERKKQVLFALEAKRKEQIAKARLVSVKQSDHKPEHNHVSLATIVYRARKAKSKSPPPPNTAKSIQFHHNSRQQKPHHVITNSAGMSEKKAEEAAEFRTKMLLQEFESIVQNEISVLKRKGSEEVTTISKVSILNERSKSAVKLGNVKISSSTFLHPFPFGKASQETLSKSELERMNSAAIVIQSAYRGYRLKKIWNQVSQTRSQRPSRRISFYRSRTPEVMNKRLPLLSPAHSLSQPSIQTSKSAFGLPLEFSTYIPPPSSIQLPTSADAVNKIASSRTSEKFLIQPVSVSTSRDKRQSRRFDEPFPTEAIKQLNHQSPMSPIATEHSLRRDLTSPVVNLAQVQGISSLFSPSIPPFSMVLKEKVRLLLEKQTAAMSSPAGTDRRKSTSNVPGDYYSDSDSTQHASITRTPRRHVHSSGSEPTITDDYIGPNEEAMNIAYNLRKSPKISLEPDASLGKKQKISKDEDTDEDNPSTILSNRTSSISDGMDTEEEMWFPHRRSRRDFNENSGFPKSLTDFRLKITEKNNEVLKKAVHASLETLRKHEKDAATRGAASEVKSTPMPDHLERWAQVAMTQAESIKTTAEVNQWLVEMNRTSMGVPEYRKNEMANLAAVVVAAVQAVEQTKAQNNPGQNQNRVILHTQEAQTTNSLFQKDKNYSEEEFSDTSQDVSHEVSKDFEDAKTKLKESEGQSSLQEISEEKSTIPEAVQSVEQTKAQNNPPVGPNQNRVILHTQEAQTTNSLFQKDTNYSEEEFLDTSQDVSHGVSKDFEDANLTKLKESEDQSSLQQISEEKSTIPEAVQDNPPVGPTQNRVILHTQEAQMTNSLSQKDTNYSEEEFSDISQDVSHEVSNDFEDTNLIKLKESEDQSSLQEISEEKSASPDVSLGLDLSFLSTLNAVAEEVIASKDKTESGLPPPPAPSTCTTDNNVKVPVDTNYSEEEFSDISPDVSHEVSKDFEAENLIKLKESEDQSSLQEISEEKSTSPDDNNVKVPVDSEKATDKKVAVEDELEMYEQAQEEAELDMMELSRFQEEHGAPIPKPVTKWSVRPRDIVDHVLVGELVESNREWTDYRKEEEAVKDALADAVIKKALRETLKSIARVIDK